jgi:hypothetical protein
MWQKAQNAALDAARKLEAEAGAIGIMRSVDATEASKWLREVAAAIREACGPELPRHPDTGIVLPDDLAEPPPPAAEGSKVEP